VQGWLFCTGLWGFAAAQDQADKDKAREYLAACGKVVCEICGSCYNKKNKARHLKTRKCQAVKYVWVERFEISR
jgi:hypothetical protein